MNNRKDRNLLSKREFLATIGINSLPQIVWKTSDWKLNDFQRLVHDEAPVKQLFDARAINQGAFLTYIKNSLNGLHFGFGVPSIQIKLVGALHGPANLLNFDSYIWNKYQIGAWLQVDDPDTDKPAIKNPFYKSRSSGEPDYRSNDPDDLNSRFQDASMEALSKRGVQFCCCHTALEEQAKVLVKHNHLSMESEALVQEMLAHTLPGVLVVASMVSAIALLQVEGHYSYISV
jgi:intracellular sulfur oxidation DsrE/DsrF family protein